MLITNNHASFYFVSKQNLFKHEKVLKFYEHYCFQNFVLLFMSSLTASVVKNSHVLAGIFFIFLKNDLDQVYKRKSLNTKFRPQWNDQKSSSQVKPILVAFSN